VLADQSSDGRSMLSMTVLQEFDPPTLAAFRKVTYCPTTRSNVAGVDLQDVSAPRCARPISLTSSKCLRMGVRAGWCLPSLRVVEVEVQ